MTTWMKTQTFFRRPIYVAMEDEGVSSSIIHTGGWESHIEKYIIENMPVDGVFLDVGANLGFFSLLAADKMQEDRSSGRVIAVEANPIVLPYLMASIVESGLEHRIDVIPYAASGILGLVQMQENFVNNLGGVPMKELSELLPSKNRKVVPTVELDDILVDLTRLDLVKMDIEGAEPKAIEGMSGLLHKFSPDIIMEINADCLRGVSNLSVAGMVEQMEFHGYKPHTFRYDVEPVTKEEVVGIVSSHNYYDFLFSKKMG
jgi:FkbM family methyltransferase